jgi:hypothetical protein
MQFVETIEGLDAELAQVKADLVTVTPPFAPPRPKQRTTILVTGWVNARTNSTVEIVYETEKEAIAKCPPGAYTIKVTGSREVVE